MDAAYLQKHVGPALAQALSEVVVKNPEDAIDFIGNYLIQYANVSEDSSNDATKEETTRNILSEQKSTLSQQVAAKQAAASELAEAEARFESPEDGVVKPTLGPELREKTFAVVQKVVDYIKSRTGADACYMGELRSMPEDGPKFLSYSTASKESNFLVDNSVALTEPEPDEDEENPKTETGAITWTLFDPVHDEPPPESEIPEDPDPETQVAPVVPLPLATKIHV